MPSIRWISTTAAIVFGMFELGCATKSDGDTGSTEAVEMACDATSIFDSEACLSALSDRCRALSTEAACWEAAAYENVHCAWAHVSVLDDEASCGFEEHFGRCEAALAVGFGDGAVADSCVDGMHYEEPGMTVLVEPREFVDMVAAPDGSWYAGPIGPWNDSSAVSRCDPGVADAPSWCTCAEAACEAF